MIKRLLQRISPNTLRKKTTLFILLPTFIFLAGIGFVGNELVRNALQAQWQQTAITQLERSAHKLDMRLMRPKEILNFIQDSHENLPNPTELQVLLDLLRRQEGVIQATITWFVESADSTVAGSSQNNDQGTALRGRQAPTITPPIYNESLEKETVSLQSFIYDENGDHAGKIEVVVNFYDLIDQIVKAPWWRSDQVVLIDNDGRVLLRTPLPRDFTEKGERDMFGTNDQLEHDILRAMANTMYGTVFSNDNNSDRVSGFYHLHETPWTIIIISQADRVLQPILKFRTFFLILGGLSIIAALTYIRLVINSITRAVREVSEAANALASVGTYSPLKVRSQDEVGELTKSFNIMASQLEERLQLRLEMNMAREVQQNFLPQTSYSADGLEIFGVSIYCQQAGGDYFDILPSASKSDVATVVVGDVVGHGIGAALLMASLRAMIRSRSTAPGTGADIVSHVNRLLCQDTKTNGNFSTLFHLTIDRPNAKLHWIRCGHDPAMVYLVNERRFIDLAGEGVVLGVDDSRVYHENSLSFQDTEQIILIGSDGIWEAENASGERFGKERLQHTIARHHMYSAEMLVKMITEELYLFLGENPLRDDVTMAIIKTWQ